MFYENIRVVGKREMMYIVCWKSNGYWVVCKNTNSYKDAKNFIELAENKGIECILIWNKGV